MACLLHDVYLARILVEAGAYVNLINPIVGTPLQSACNTFVADEQKKEQMVHYLIDEAKANIDLVGGDFGCAFNVACGFSGSKIVRVLLEKGAKANRKDRMGRAAIHLAAARSMENFEAVLQTEVDLDLEDNMGRVPLHWAAMGGTSDVVDRIISLCSGKVDFYDRDGWTPFLYAARGCGNTGKTVSSDTCEEVIRLLLSRGADPCVIGRAFDREWSPVKVARYHGVNMNVIQLLEKNAKEKLEASGGKNRWDERFHALEKAMPKNIFCSCCLSVRILPLSLINFL